MGGLYNLSFLLHIYQLNKKIALKSSLHKGLRIAFLKLKH